MLLPESRVPTHPGELLRLEFLEPLGITQVALAAHIGVPVQRVNELVRGKRGVTPDTAWLLAQAFETTPDFWMNLQAAYDLARTRPSRTIPPLKSASWRLSGRQAHCASAAARYSPGDGSTVKPSSSAAEARRSSRQTISCPPGRSRAHTSAAASCRASAARSG